MSIRTIIFITMFIGVLSFVPNIANAECATGAMGTVYCSKYPGSGAATGAMGTVYCGKGECRTGAMGTVYCSKVKDGGAAVGAMNQVKCVGGCERGKSSMCVKAE